MWEREEDLEGIDNVYITGAAIERGRADIKWKASSVFYALTLLTSEKTSHNYQQFLKNNKAFR